MTAPSRSLGELADALEGQALLDPVADLLAPAAGTLARSRWVGYLRGQPLGHAAHPMLSDLPLGCFTSASIVDLIGGRRGAQAATRLVGIGLLSLPVTAVTGLVDWHEAAEDPRVRRVGAVHAVGNLVAGALYLSSYRHRRAGRRLRGVAMTLAGSAVAAGSGYLGGHMAFTRAAGQGERPPGGHRARTSTDADPSGASERVVDPPLDPIADQMRDVTPRP
jgi:uncharacterized membrane protein